MSARAAMVVAGCLVAGLSLSAPARAHQTSSDPAAADQQVPPPAPTPGPYPSEMPPPPSPATDPVEAPPPAPIEPVEPPPMPVAPAESAAMNPGVQARSYEPRPLSGLGVALTAGGGVGGFFNGNARDAASDGFAWDVRLTLGTRIPVGLDVAYVGSVQDMKLTGLGSDALLVGNGAETALRVQYPRGLVRPYVAGGIGWIHYSVEDSDLVSGLLGSDNIGTVPLAAGVAIGYVNGFTLDLRASSRIAFDDDLLDQVSSDSDLSSWGFTARLGAEF